MTDFKLICFFQKATLVKAFLAIAMLTVSVLPSAHATDVADFALGEHNICVVDSEGVIDCRSIEPGRRYLPADTTGKYTAVSSGGSHSCAITEAGEIECWGLANFGALNSPVSSSPFVAISSSEAHSCALDSAGSVSCWGLNTNGQTDVPADNTDFVAIYTGAVGSCGTKSTGETVCWSNAWPYASIDGQSGIIDMQLAQRNNESSCIVYDTGTPLCYLSYHRTAPLDDGPYSTVSANAVMACGLRTDGNMDCNLRDITQTNTALNRALLANIESLPPLIDFDMHFEYPYHISFCGVDVSRRLHCFGDSLPANELPGQQADLPVPNNLAISVYGDNVAELLWDVNLADIRGAQGQFRIYRNGEMVNQSFANASYLDRDFKIGEPYVYEVAYIAPDGMEGERSEPLIVNGDVTAPNNDIVLSPVISENSLTGMMVSRYGEGSLELFWERPTAIIRQYDVYRNGKLVASVPGPSFFDNQINTTNAYQYTITAINSGGGIEAIGFAQVDSFNGLACF